MLTMERTKQMAKRISQKERILRWLKDFGSITRAESFTQLGIVELSARIIELEREGYRFNRETVTTENRYGEPVSFTRYSLKERADA